ncbi:MAG: DUF1573 domain-containing protein [Bacteroidales bacterium]|nr:DUF1573 domain-containing protein [Candidatus Physcousia equi]
MKLKIWFTAALAALTLSTHAQNKLVVDQPLAHMGEIIFQTPKSVTFTIKNKGKQAVEITDVKPSCGCTQATWTRGTIAPGAKAQVTAVYDAMMLGHFQKELAVYVTGSDKPLYLQMEGRVVTKKLNYTGDFPIDLGGIRINTNYLEFDKVNRGDHPAVELQIFNQERTPYRPQLMHLPDYLMVQSFPEVIAGGRTGRVRITLQSEKLPRYGLSQTRIYLARHMGDKVSSKNEILVSSVLLPNFSQLTPEQLALAPQMELSQEELTFAMKGKKKQTQTVTLSNMGQQPLNISQVQVFNPAIAVSVGDRVVQPGRSTQVKVTINEKYLKKGKARPRILFITNDPKRPQQTINMTVEQ